MNPAGLMPEARNLRLLDEDDLSWIADMLDILTACRGQPWRIALERLEGLQPVHHANVPPGVPAPPPRVVSPKRVTAVIRAIQRVLGRNAHSDLARTCRALVLGRAALAPGERDDRIAAAARALELSLSSVEQLLWVDLPRERPIELPFGRPGELEIAAFANVQLIEKTLRRSHAVQLRVRGDAGPLLRGAARCGLLATARSADPARTLGSTDDAALGSADGSTLIDLVGPIALFHRTAVYGRAVAALVPLLSEVESFELIATSTGFAGDYAVSLGSPALLPRTPAALLAPSKLVTRLARELRERLSNVSVESAATTSQRARDTRIVIGPPPLHVRDGTLLCPDLIVGDTHIEMLGFWTRDYLARKLAAYEVAGARVILCVDETRGCAAEDVPPFAISYIKHVDADEVLRRMRANDSLHVIPGDEARKEPAG